jgi:NAD(P)H-flavin reductase
MGFVAVLERRVDLSHSVYLLTFRSEVPVSWVPGQFFNVWVPIVLNGVSTKKRKSYSIASAPRSDCTFDICIKKVPGGLTSNEMYVVHIGSRLDFEGPLGHFCLKDGNSIAAMLATGTGIAPFRAMLQHMIAKESSRKVVLVHGVRTEEDLLFREEFEDMARRNLSFSYVPTLSRPGDAWTGSRGYVQLHISDLLEETSDVDFYLCGLAPMITACVEECTKLGVTRERIHREVYT